jgi:MinD-like ATPase involved in chromosome partitioning or flagellar assembly/DNA-binding TFAR19-related protein (PDSD5 family)
MTTQGRPKVIGFYAYKGGTGRSFCLAHTAWALAREGRRIVVVDLDLSAPSLWALFGRKPAPGLVEYLGQWSRRSSLKVQDLVEEIPLDPKASGALYLLQAGSMDKSYLETLQSLDWRELMNLPPPQGQPGKNRQFRFSSPFDDLFDELTESFRPDAILIDAPTGFNDTSNLCLRSLTDLVIAIFGPLKVQLDGIGKVVSLLTEEQQERIRRGQEPKPDVFCVASTILASRFSGPHLQRIQDAFEYLNRVRLEVLQRVERSDDETADIADVARQDQAIITYDERLADLERLSTEEEPRENHFAAFQEVVSYVTGALPSPRPAVLLDVPKKERLLVDIEPCYELFAEQDPRLVESLFLRTQHIEELETPRVAVILGGKGSGKTALFSYVTRKRKDVFAVHGPQRRLGPDLLCEIQDALPSMDVFWRLYMLSALPDLSAIADSEIRHLAGALSRLPDQPTTVDQFIQGLRAVDLGVRVLDAWRQLDDSLAGQGKQIALCLDGLDAAFKANPDRRRRGLVDLFTAWQASFSSLKRVTVKVFLRTDLWQDLSFPEKSHIRGKEMKLAWDDRNLWRLVVKRALHSQEFHAWCERSLPAPAMNRRAVESAAVESAAETDLHPYLDLLFEHHIWTGKNSLSRNWVLRRLRDAKGAVYPRDLICLFREAISVERNRLREHQRTSEESVISRQSLSDALEPTSRQRVDALREEYPELAPALEKLRGLTVTGRIEQLKEQLDDRQINVLSEAGVIGLTEGEYVVPDLYRHGLNMPRMGPR